MKVTTAGGQFYYMADINRVVYADDVRHIPVTKRYYDKGHIYRKTQR